MDLVLDIADAHLFDTLYKPFNIDSSNIWRQFISLYIITLFGILLFYLVFSTLSYFLIFDKEQEKHPKFLKNQIKREISVALNSFPWMALMTVPWFLAEVRGYSRLYSEVGDWKYLLASAIAFLAFTDMMIYWIHRWLHHPILYGRIHKPHHYWIIPTPFASHAFHPLDGYSQSLPYHIFVFIIPMNSMLYLGLYMFVNMWTISIHDGFHSIESDIINSAAHHAVHHEQFSYNYGQYFTIWDRIGKTYKKPIKKSD